MKASTRTSRRAERIFAFKVLYSLSFSPASMGIEELAKLVLETPENTTGEINEFAWTLIAGTWLKQAEIDQVLSKFSQNWKINRIAKVELTLLRLALFELLFQKEAPVRVIINEAIELSKSFGDDKSRTFVNGILDAALKALESSELQRQAFIPPQPNLS